MAYNHSFYLGIRPGVVRSAQTVVPLVLGLLDEPPRTVVDIGCGEGWWAAEFDKRGATVLGVDSHGLDPVAIPGRFLPHDLRNQLPLRDLGRFDLAVCLEVAEHLHANRAATFVAELCELAPTVLWSAAVPGQRGVEHINEQWPEYWLDLFHEHGYRGSGAIRPMIWNNDAVDWWYRQNILVFSADWARHPDLFDSPYSTPFSLVHPAMVQQMLDHPVRAR